MQHDQQNPALSGFLAIESIIQFGLLLAAFTGMFVLPTIGRAVWPWDIAPFNAAFIGAVYGGSAMAALMPVLRQRWYPARIVLTMVFFFAAYVLVISFVYLERFNFSRFATWMWFFFYILLPVNAGYFLWRNRGWEQLANNHLSDGWKVGLMVVGGVLLAYALAMLVAPLAATAFWPWAIDEFHGRMYASIFLGLGVGSLLVARGAPAVEHQALALGGSVFAISAILGLVIIDSQQDRIDWSAAGTWGWIAICAAVLIVSAAGVVVSRRGEGVESKF